jgi:hypothetical protein
MTNKNPDSGNGEGLSSVSLQEQVAAGIAAVNRTVVDISALRGAPFTGIDLPDHAAAQPINTAPDSVARHQAMLGRIVQWCDWFGTHAPTTISGLDRERPGMDEVVSDDELFRWCDEVGTSIDWIYAGDVRGLAAGYRSKFLSPPPSERSADARQISAYLTSLQETANQLEALIMAVNSLIVHDHRRDMAVGILESAQEIAGELTIALDTVTIDKELAEERAA